MGHRFSLQRDRKNSIRQPVADFKAAFSDDIAAFREHEISIPAFGAAFDKHRIAVDKIMLLLDEKDRVRLQQAWDEYSSIAKGFEPEQKKTAIAGYNHPDFFSIGKRRLRALSSCLDHLA